MTILNAISQKILLLCKQENVSINKLAYLCCITQSSLQNLVSERSKNPKLLTIIRICQGLDMTLYDFFEDELFCEIEFDI